MWWVGIEGRNRFMKISALSVVAIAAATFSVGAFAQSPSAAPVDSSAFLNQFESTLDKFEGYRRSGVKQR